MSADIPRNAELQHADVLSYADGELVWAPRNRKTQEPAGRLRDEEIVFALERPGGDGYLVYGLVEEQTQAPSGDPPDRPFMLSALLTPSLPREVLEAHLLRTPPVHLRCGAADRRRLDVIVSTRSGTCLAQHFYDDVLKPLLGALGIAESGTPRGPGYHVTITQSPQTIKHLARDLWAGGEESAADRPARTIVLLSGDGGVVDLLNGRGDDNDQAGGPRAAPLPRPTVALLPLGTGNALFHSLHRPRYLERGRPVPPSSYVLGLRTLFGGATAALPTFEAAFSPGARLVSFSEPGADGADAAGGGDQQQRQQQQQCETAVGLLRGAIVASYGFHASLVWESDTPEYRRHGDKRFGMAARELLATGHAYRAVVEARAPGGAVPARLAGERFGYVLATMVSNLEKTFTISPASRPLAGDLRLVHFGNVGGEKTMDVMMAAYNEGSHVGMTWTNEDGSEDGVGYDEVEEIKVTVLEEDSRWRKVCIDGEIVELERDGWMVVKKTAESQLDIVVDKLVLGRL